MMWCHRLGPIFSCSNDKEVSNENILIDQFIFNCLITDRLHKHGGIELDYAKAAQVDQFIFNQMLKNGPIDHQTINNSYNLNWKKVCSFIEKSYRIFIVGLNPKE